MHSQLSEVSGLNVLGKAWNCAGLASDAFLLQTLVTSKNIHRDGDGFACTCTAHLKLQNPATGESESRYVLFTRRIRKIDNTWKIMPEIEWKDITEEMVTGPEILKLITPLRLNHPGMSDQQILGLHIASDEFQDVRDVDQALLIGCHKAYLQKAFGNFPNPLKSKPKQIHFATDSTYQERGYLRYIKGELASPEMLDHRPLEVEVTFPSGEKKIFSAPDQASMVSMLQGFKDQTPRFRRLCLLALWAKASFQRDAMLEVMNQLPRSDKFPVDWGIVRTTLKQTDTGGILLAYEWEVQLGDATDPENQSVVMTHRVKVEYEFTNIEDDDLSCEFRIVPSSHSSVAIAGSPPPVQYSTQNRSEDAFGNEYKRNEYGEIVLPGSRT